MNTICLLRFTDMMAISYRVNVYKIFEILREEKVNNT